MGQPVEITRTEHSATELRALAAKIKDAAVVRRLLKLTRFGGAPHTFAGGFPHGQNPSTLLA